MFLTKLYKSNKKCLFMEFRDILVIDWVMSLLEYIFERIRGIGGPAPDGLEVFFKGILIIIFWLGIASTVLWVLWQLYYSFVSTFRFAIVLVILSLIIQLIVWAGKKISYR